MAKNVIVDSVTKGGTDKAPAAVLHYIGDNGEIWKISNLAKNLPEETRTRLKTVVKGDKVSIEIKKEGNFWNLISVGDPVAQTATNKAYKATYSKAPTEGRLTDAEKAAGAQRGNVLTNAVNLAIASGAVTNNATNTAALVKSIAVELMKVSNSLEEETIIANTAEADTQAVQASMDLEDPEVTNDLGF